MAENINNIIDNVLVSLRDKYNGRYQKESLSNISRCDFLFRGRKFFATPWEIITGRYAIGTRVEGISLSCYCQSSSHFWIVEEGKGFFDKWLAGWKAKKEGDEIIAVGEGMTYVFKGKNHEGKILLLKNPEFTQVIKSLLCKETLILRLYQNWLTFATKVYDEPTIEKLEQLASLLEINSVKAKGQS